MTQLDKIIMHQEATMNFETKAKLELAAIIVGGIILFSLPILLMANVS
jgi:hypothetical protein